MKKKAQNYYYIYDSEPCVALNDLEEVKRRGGGR